MRLYQYIIIVFKVRNSNTRGKDKAIIIILLTMATCSILLSEHWHELVPKGTSRGSRSFPGSWAFLFENCWFGEVQKTQDIEFYEMPKTPNKVLKSICHLWCSRSRCSTVVGSCCTTASGRWRCSRGFWYKYFFGIWEICLLNVCVTCCLYLWRYLFALIFQRTLGVQCSHLSQCHNNVRIRRRRPLAQTHIKNLTW